MLEQPIPANSREARKADRRRTILEVAERSFMEKGFAETSMSTIAAELGGSKTTLWSYFPSKEALFTAVLEAKTATFQRALDEALLPAGGTAAALTRFGTILLRKFTAPDSIKLHRLIIGEADRFASLCRVFAERGPDRLRKRLCRYMEEEMAAGRLREGPPMLLARQFIALCQATTYPDRLWRPEALVGLDVASDVSAAVETFMRAWGPDR